MSLNNRLRIRRTGQIHVPEPRTNFLDFRRLFDIIMGQAHSLGRNNSEFVDNLVEYEQIEQPAVEFITRLVDRKHFFPRHANDEAYREGAWREGAETQAPLHISAPAIYSTVLENLDLKRGQSFLNVGSGTGYLSTLVGMFLGSTGISHGIEIYPEIVTFACNKRKEFLDGYPPSLIDWCPPEYFVGDVFQMKTEMRYDRIYCGAGVPDGCRLRFLKLLKVEGICIMPYNGSFQKIRRASEKTFIARELSSVDFGLMVDRSEGVDPKDYWEIPNVTGPPSLFTFARATIRQAIRDGIGKSQMVTVRQKRKAEERRAYPYDATEDEMLIEAPRIDAPNENVDNRIQPETDSEGYVIHQLRRNGRIHIQLNNAINDDDEGDFVGGAAVFVPGPDSDNDTEREDDDEEISSSSDSSSDEGTVRASSDREAPRTDDEEEEANDTENSNENDEEMAEEADVDIDEQLGIDLRDGMAVTHHQRQNNRRHVQALIHAVADEILRDDERVTRGTNNLGRQIMEHNRRVYNQRIRDGVPLGLFPPRNNNNGRPRSPEPILHNGFRLRFLPLTDREREHIIRDDLEFGDGSLYNRHRENGGEDFQRISPPRVRPTFSVQEDEVSTTVPTGLSPADTGPSPPSRKRKNDNSDSNEKRYRVDQKYYDAPKPFNYSYIRVAVPTSTVPYGQRPNYQKALEEDLAVFDMKFRHFIRILPIPKKTRDNLLFSEAE